MTTSWSRRRVRVAQRKSAGPMVGVIRAMAEVTIDRALRVVNGGYAVRRGARGAERGKHGQPPGHDSGVGGDALIGQQVGRREAVDGGGLRGVDL